MNSTAVGTELARMTAGTVRSADGRSGNGTSRLILKRGSGSSRRIAFVTMPSVPSEPTIRSFKL